MGDVMFIGLSLSTSVLRHCHKGATAFYNNKPAAKKEYLLAWTRHSLLGIIHLYEHRSTSFAAID
jgi:hypothetical protein